MGHLRPLLTRPGRGGGRGGSAKIAVHDRHSLWRNEMELGFVHPRIKLPIRELKFDLHTSRINDANAKQFASGRIQLEQNVRPM